jgi:hypothetical protein
LGAAATVTSFPLSKHTGEVGPTHTFSNRHVYLQFMWEVTLPPSPVEFSSCCHFYKLSCSKVSGWVPPRLPSLASLFIYSYVWDCSYPLRRSGRPALFATCLFCCCCYTTCFLLFCLGGGRSVQGALLIWPRVVCGSTACCFAHLVVCIFPSGVGAGIWGCGSPPCFSV